MKQDKNGNLIHEDYTSMFSYGGTNFIVDKFEDFWLITQCNFLVKERGETLEEAKTKIKKRWDNYDTKKTRKV